MFDGENSKASSTSFSLQTFKVSSNFASCHGKCSKMFFSNETSEVKTAARNRIGDQFLSDCMVCFIEKELFDSVSNEKVIKKFQMMNERRVVL